MQKIDLRTCSNNSRKLFSLLTVFVLCAQLFAHSGIVSGEKNLRVAKTKWFDIIYPARCEESASILFNKADTVYEEVTAQYGLTPSFRIPVVITPTVDRFNAFWTAVPYNHIAIYDTGSSGAGELAVFSETLLSTFRHELTHAVTYNMKSTFWRGVGAVFGDCVFPGMLSVTTGMAEGATVTSESAAGEGRLNSEYAKHYVKQAKIEDDFPAYHDVSGAADIQPGGAPYYFNGAFHQWLQEKYGLPAYADFWYRVVNFKNKTVSGAFKKAFGIKLKKAWELFEKDYEVPDIPANPVKAGLVQDFFEPEDDDFSIKNDSGSLYASLTASRERLVWLDGFGGRVYSINTTDITDKEAHNKPDQLFALRGISGVRLSNDGRFLAVSYYNENSYGDKACVKIYDFENSSFYSVKEDSLKDALVVENDGSYYLVAQKYLAQHYSIAVYTLALDSSDGRIKEAEPFAELRLDQEINPYSFVALDDGNFAYLKKDRLTYSLCVSKIDGNLIREYSFPAGMAVNSLSYSALGDQFYFSYAKKNTLPRLGKLEAASGALSLSTQDISGGVFEPVYWNGKIVYIGEFFRMSRLLCMEDNGGANTAGVGSTINTGSTISLENSTSSGSTINSPDLTILSNPALFNSVNPLATTIPSKPYNPLPYLFRGVFIPLSTYQSDYFGCNTGYSSENNKFYIGATYITANPWANGTGDLLTLTGGWNTLSNSFGASVKINKGTANSLFQSQTELKSEFDSKGWKQGGGILTLSSTFRTGNISRVLISNTASALFGRQDKQLYIEEGDKGLYATFNFWDKDKIGITAPADDAIYCGLSDVLTLAFSTVRRAGPGRFENQGITLSVSYGTWFDKPVFNSDYDKKLEDCLANSLAASLTLCAPRLLPIESKYGFTYNLPATLNFKLLPSSSNYAYAVTEEEKPEKKAGRVVFDGSLESVFFSMDIQKAIPAITAVYLNDIYIAGGYAAVGTAGQASKSGFQTARLGDYFSAIADGRGYFIDSIYIKTGIELTPNIGYLANPGMKMNLFAIYSFTLHSDKKLRPQDRTKISLGLNMNL